MNRERLIILRDALRDPRSIVPNLVGFDMGGWGYLFRAGIPKPAALFDENENACGTVCCAMGFAGQVPELNRRGLKFYLDTQLFEVDGDLDGDGFGAGARFFGISYSIAHAIFSPDPERFYDFVLDRDEREGDRVNHLDVANMIDAILNGDVTDRTIQDYNDEFYSE